MELNYYALLGVKEDATLDEVKKAYRKRARAFHPDVNPGAGDMLALINTAYETLSDEGKRLDYDRLLRAEQQPQPEPQPEPAEPSWGEPFEPVADDNTFIYEDISHTEVKESTEEQVRRVWRNFLKRLVNVGVATAALPGIILCLIGLYCVVSLVNPGGTAGGFVLADISEVGVALVVGALALIPGGLLGWLWVEKVRPCGEKLRRQL